MALRARLLSVWLSLTSITPFTAPFSALELGDLNNPTGFGAGLLIKADTAPSESLAIAAPAMPSSLLSAVLVVDAFQPTEGPSHIRRTPIVLRL